ncbi:MAG: Na+/H+ antiporter subunit E [Ignavibacteria bacterium]|nr:Na+/H+ antiporter subunit E [Ignavibacteria bacterium]
MNGLLLNILLATAWVFLTGELDFQNFIEGFVIGFVIIFITRNVTSTTSYLKKIPKIIGFIFYFSYELILANIKVTIDILTPCHRMTPAIIAVPLTVDKNFEISLLANLITLTPGTLSMDLSSDKKILYVHSMYVDNPEDFINSIKNGFEKKIMEITR